MMDSDSEDELMKTLDAFGTTGHLCSYCDDSSAHMACTTCGTAYYCDQSCLRGDFAKHRPYCITACLEDQSEEGESEDGEYTFSDSEEEDEEEITLNNASSSHTKTSDRKVSRSNSVSTQGQLTDKQLKKLMQLSSVNVDVDAQGKEILKLQKAITHLTAQGEERFSERSLSETRMSLSGRESITDGHNMVRKRELQDLQRQLQSLERKARQGAFESVVYTPLLVRNDPVYTKYIKLLEMDMSKEAIQQKMKEDGVDPLLLERMDDISPNDVGPPEGSYVPLVVEDDPKLRKYFKLLNMQMSVHQIQMKMELEGVDPELLFKPKSISPNDPGPEEPVREASPVLPISMMPAMLASSNTTQQLLVRDDPAFAKYFKLHKLGLGDEQIQMKMKMDGLDPTLWDKKDDISPNSPPPSSGQGVNMEQLFAMVMQHQQLIQNGSSTSNGSATSPMLSPPMDELTSAEDAVNSLFGASDGISASGMTMVQQLDKKARKKENQLLVTHHDKIVACINDIVNHTFTSDTEAISFIKPLAKQLDSHGLTLGATPTNSWSARLLIRSKETKESYFTDEERSNAGKAYTRLWSVSTLWQYVDQLEDKERQIRSAPDILKDRARSKPDLIDKYTLLLKESVKVMHKIFNSSHYNSEMERMLVNKIPQDMAARRINLTQSASILALSALEMAEEEFKNLDAAVRGKSLRAHGAVHVGEKALHLVVIIEKLGVSGVPTARRDAVKRCVEDIRTKYLTVEEEASEEEDDML